ncbi:MAG TPA: tripartite tricarboxylate transporter TctB family protein [Hyphomicrobiaceae bacterium]|nr:tripartite tricarboxylate transporter TctB family protein [Hyphomicrobiaceae bacterium]
MLDPRPSDSEIAHGRGLIKSPSDLAAGMFLLALAAVGYFGSLSLKFGTLSNIGPGLMPRSIAVLVGAFGVLLIVQSFFFHGSRLERWSIRGPFFILGAIVLFALTIRGTAIPIDGKQVQVVPALGLLVAGPLAMIFSGFASNETKLKEIIPFALVLTALCYLMFKVVLRLPIPVLPILLGY